MNTMSLISPPNLGMRHPPRTQRLMEPERQLGNELLREAAIKDVP
jgi:hypothetical protein